MADVIYTRALQEDVVNGENCIRLLAPARGEFNRLVIKVVGGAGAITSAVVYDRRDACDGSVRSDNPDDLTEAFDPVIHQITPVLSPSNGIIEQYEKYWLYANRDEQVITSRLERQLWLSVTVDDAATIQIGYTIAVREPLT